MSDDEYMVCISCHDKESITYGKAYKMLKESSYYPGENCFVIINDKGQEDLYSKSRFISLSEFAILRNSKIDKILD